MTQFTPVSAVTGGVLIGLSASLLLLTHGRVAGISGIYKGLMGAPRGDRGWRLAFVAGLVLAGLASLLVAPGGITVSADRSLAATAVAGLVVGVGVSLGNGCTSGHGVCGLSRLSRRSLAATAAFMATGMLTATGLQLLTGGAL
jgi:uncharacterized membrane protein YedE/YeeE